jgi:hypothetical protein
MNYPYDESPIQPPLLFTPWLKRHFVRCFLGKEFFPGVMFQDFAIKELVSPQIYVRRWIIAIINLVVESPTVICMVH